MLDRKTVPAKHTTKKIHIPQTQQFTLTNGVKLIVVDAGTQDVSKIEVIFDAGTRYQNQALSARGAISLLSEGTSTKTSQQIAELFDFYGSFPEHSFDRDFASLTLYSTNKLLPKSLEVFADMIYNPSYPEHELELFKKKGKQALIVEMEKVVTIARQNFFSSIFGSQHPYGNYATPNDFDILNRDNVVDFHQKFHTSSNCLIILSGKITDKEIQLVEKQMGEQSFGKFSNLGTATFPTTENTQIKSHTAKNDALQSAIRIGKQTIKRNHPDFPGFMVLNTILGGYFGSRLMRNIREDKGYTYGISSAILPFKNSAVFVIGTEVGADFTNDTLKEIYKEIDILRNIKVSEEELDLVKNHLIGDVLRTFDGPFAIADSIASLYEYNDLDFGFFDRTIETIKTITSEQILSLANKYLTVDDMVECIAGKISNS